MSQTHIDAQHAKDKLTVRARLDVLLDKGLFKEIGNQTLGYRVELTDAAKDFVAEKGYDPKFGARPLNRAIQKYIEDPIAEEILKAQVEPIRYFP